ncbi:MAG: hypothetical protein ACTHJ3_07125 [Pararhizobium sp.]
MSQDANRSVHRRRGRAVAVAKTVDRTALVQAVGLSALGACAVILAIASHL